MKKIKIIIGILICLILVTIVAITIVNLKEEPLTNNNGTREVPAEVKKPLEKENDNVAFYLADDLIQAYFTYITNNKEEDNNFEVAYAILKESFVEENNLTKENLEEYFKEYKGATSYRTQEIYKEAITKSEGLANEYLYIKGILRKDGDIKNIYIAMTKDYNNETYAIEFIEPKDFEKATANRQMDKEKETIPENEYNKLEVVTLSERIDCLRHMQDYKNALMNNEEEAYQLLDEEYREKRFTSLDDFKEYRASMVESYGEESFNQYLVNDYEEYREYVCKDKYEKMYIFTEEEPMNYRLKLDNYTIMSEAFKEEYDKTDEQRKVMMNVEKWIQMLNNKDYRAAYEVLDETFRNNNFESEEQFKEIMKDRLKLYYHVGYGEFEKENNTYIQNILLSDTLGEQEEIIPVTIIMQLKDDYEFVMSFEME